MSGLGERLRRAREAQGLDLEALQERTKIQKRYLAYMEAGEWDKLPGAFYARAFVRRVAEALGLEAEALLQEHADELPPVDEAPPAVPLRRSEPVPRRPVFGPWVARLLMAVFLFFVLLIIYRFLSEAGRPPLGGAAPDVQPEPKVESRLPSDENAASSGAGGPADRGAPAGGAGSGAGSGGAGGSGGNGPAPVEAPSATGPPPTGGPGAASEGGGEKPSAPVLEFQEEVGKTSRYVLRAPAFDAVVAAARGDVWVEVRAGGKDGRVIFTGTLKGGKEQPIDAGSATRLYFFLGRTQNADLRFGETTLSLAGKPDAYRVDVTLVPPGTEAGGTP
ncbi:MAG: DUF4115 domain-containing protein [Hydrogenibacillus schlegelii]|nr:DUF4115 domain-containing protein [Hydrogenibacillus schlegelii]